MILLGAHSLITINTVPKGSFRHIGENSRQGKGLLIMRSRSKRYLCWLRLKRSLIFITMFF